MYALDSFFYHLENVISIKVNISREKKKANICFLFSVLNTVFNITKISLP